MTHTLTVALTSLHCGDGSLQVRPEDIFIFYGQVLSTTLLARQDRSYLRWEAQRLRWDVERVIRGRVLGSRVAPDSVMIAWHAQASRRNGLHASLGGARINGRTRQCRVVARQDQGRVLRRESRRVDLDCLLRES